ncbi:MAG: hypothetical protein II623_04350, partial [Paludibacteraceae bacterium]|nr:hypothetical protein [Paludibacteraceae bacterium]
MIPFSSKAEMTGKNWYGADGAVIESQNSCNSVYRITLTPQNDGQLQLFKDGKDVNSTNTVFASDIPSSISWQTGSSGDNAVKFSNPDNNEELATVFTDASGHFVADELPYKAGGVSTTYRVQAID